MKGFSTPTPLPTFEVASQPRIQIWDFLDIHPSTIQLNLVSLLLLFLDQPGLAIYCNKCLVGQEKQPNSPKGEDTIWL